VMRNVSVSKLWHSGTPQGKSRNPGRKKLYSYNQSQVGVWQGSHRWDD